MHLLASLGKLSSDGARPKSPARCAETRTSQGGPWYQIMPVAAAASVGAGAGAGSGSGVAHDDAVTAAPTSAMRRALASETHTAPRPSPADLRRWVWHCCRSRMEPLRRLFLQKEYHHISACGRGLVSNNLGVFIAVREMAVDRRTRYEPRHQSAITPEPAHSVLERIRGLGCAEM